MTTTLIPATEALAALAANPDDGPVVMLNLLKFKRDDGWRNYSEYSTAFQTLLQQQGGRLVYVGQATEPLISADDWDMVALVEYPSRQVFLQLTSSPAYRAIAPLREQGLERTLLYATTPRT